MGSVCIIHSRLKEKNISGLRVAEKKAQNFTFLIKSNLKYKSYLAYIITPHCNSRFGTISFSLPDINS